MLKKKKAITFSYDDGVTQDVRLIALLNKYNIKGTFNLNSELLGKEGILQREGKMISHTKNNPRDIKAIYEGHEIAAHTLTHPLLPSIMEDQEIIRQVEEDRVNLSKLVGYDVCGMAYPCGGENNDARVANLIKEHTGIQYARVLKTSGEFTVPADLYRLEGTIYHHEEWDKLFEMGKRFIDLKTEEPSIFYIWGHSYEFDIFPERWEQFEEFCNMISGREDIFYGTNKEVLLEPWWM